MRTIFKYEVPLLDGEIEIAMHCYANIICVGSQYGHDVTMWAEVDTDKDLETRSFSIIGTGHLRQPEMLAQYVGTAITEGGRLIWHLYENKIQPY